MKYKFSKSRLHNAIESGMSNLSCEDIKNLIKKETRKSVNDIDADYIDLCFELLEIKQKENDNPSIRKRRILHKPIIKKVLLAAALFAVLMIATLTVSAEKFNLNIYKPITTVEKGNYRINLYFEPKDKKADGYRFTDTPFAKYLEEEYGISPVTLPEELINGNTHLYSMKGNRSDDAFGASFFSEIESFGNRGYIEICQNKTKDSLVGDYDFVTGVEEIHKVQANGMGVLIVDCGDHTVTKYIDAATEYTIHLEGDMDFALKFVNSIQ